MVPDPEDGGEHCLPVDERDTVDAAGRGPDNVLSAPGPEGTKKGESRD